MAQFDIVINKSRNGRTDVPYLLELQSDSVSVLETRLVAPLRRADKYSKTFISRIHLRVNVEAIDYIAYISEMAAVPKSLLGEHVSNASERRSEIISAIDLLFTGF